MVSKHKSIGVLAIDDGGYSTVVIGKDGIMDSFPSVKSIYGSNRNLTTITGKHDYIIEYNSEKYVAGTLAKFDSALPIQWHGKSKAHVFFDLSVLLSVFLYGYIDNYIAVSVPIEQHNENEKKLRIDRLKGSHTMTVNGKSKTFYISDIIVVPESACAYWINEPSGLTRWLDLGSRTVNFSSTLNEDDSVRYIDVASGTFYKGIESLGNNFDATALADYVCGRLFAKGWEENDSVNLLGGGALNEELVSSIKKYFPNAKPLELPIYSNCKGMYNLARYAFQMD